jgi:hypothetical protein
MKKCPILFTKNCILKPQEDIQINSSNGKFGNMKCDKDETRALTPSLAGLLTRTSTLGKCLVVPY